MSEVLVAIKKLDKPKRKRLRDLINGEIFFHKNKLYCLINYTTVFDFLNKKLVMNKKNW